MLIHRLKIVMVFIVEHHLLDDLSSEIKEDSVEESYSSVDDEILDIKMVVMYIAIYNYVYVCT